MSLECYAKPWRQSNPIGNESEDFHYNLSFWPTLSSTISSDHYSHILRPQRLIIRNGTTSQLLKRNRTVMVARNWLIAILFIWLIFTITRQIFDLVGRLWIAVGFNLLQMVCCLTGLFGAIQRRPPLLATLAVSNIISIAQNILVFLWYIGIFGDRTKPVLSAGLPYSFSFFLRFTPGCEAKFDLQRSRWNQTSDCPVPYYHIEAAQAILHICLALLSFILAVVVLCEKKKAKMVPSMLPQPNAVYADIKRNSPPVGPVVKAPTTAQSSVNDVSSGYMNSSFEDTTQSGSVNHDPTPKLPSNERPKKMKRTKLRPNSLCMLTPLLQAGNKHQQQLEDEFEPRQLQFYSKLNKNRDATEEFETSIPISSTTPGAKSSGRFKKSSQQKRRATVHEDAVSGMDIASDHNGISRTPSGNLTSLVSFDPKSGTLLRVREHVETDDDDRPDDEAVGYVSIEKELPVDVGGTYEKIRDVSLYTPKRNFSDRKLRSESRQRNISQDSVPSVDAPVLSSPFPDSLSSDSGLPSSNCDSQWPAPPARMDPWKTQFTNSPRDLGHRNIEASSPGIRLTQQKDYSLSPGIRLTQSLVNQPQYRSSFQVQNHDSSIVGHYHAPNEFHLTSSSDKENGASQTTNVAVINGNGLLV